MARSLYVSLGVAAIISGAVLGIGGRAMGSSYQYCVGDNVIPGGVRNAGAVDNVYSSPRVSHVYRYFGITENDIDSLGSQQVAGTVTKSGKVYVKGKIVATHAISAGCGYIPGSTKVNDGYMTFYTRPTSVSFAKSSLPAMVVMRNGQFSYAILNSCGNPIKATPVKTKKPAPVVKTNIQAQAQPQIQAQTQSQSQSIVINNSPPQVKAAQTTRPSAATTTLPNTGPGNVLGISGIATAIGSVSHYVYRRRRR